MGLFKKSKSEKPPYLERIDELAKVSIVRLKGKIERDMIPLIDVRIEKNRRAGSQIDKNVLIDFAKVVDVDSATIAFHLLRLKEYEEKGFKIGFINLIDEMNALVSMFKESKSFRIYVSEEEALKDLNKP